MKLQEQLDVIPFAARSFAFCISAAFFSFDSAIWKETVLIRDGKGRCWIDRTSSTMRATERGVRIGAME